MFTNRINSSFFRYFNFRRIKFRRYLVLRVVALFLFILILLKLLYPSTEIVENYEIAPTEAPLPPLLPGVLEDPTRRLTRKLPVSHAFIVSAYYYPISKSLGTNAVAVNMVVDARNFNIENATYHIVGSNRTHESLTVASSQIQGVIPCRYAPAVAITNTVARLKTLKMESNGIRVQIPFKRARYTAPKPVIICISPQFVAEQWQLFILQAHIAHRFGGHIHIYITSIIDSYFELIKEYEKEGYVTIDYWLRMKFAKSETSYFEPNANTELRNQAGAQTDCLLQYKEAAQYIAFFDLDDILVPVMYPTYNEEFTAEFSIQPNASSIMYPRKEHEFIKSQHLAEFSFAEITSSLKSSNTVKRGKVVVKPHRHNSTWIHASQHESPYDRHDVELLSIIHVQRPLQKNSSNEMTHLWKIDFEKHSTKFRPADIKAIDDDISRMRQQQQIADIALRLPSSDFYLPIVFKCYYDALYLKSDVEMTGVKSCPNAEFCEMPQKENINCIHSDAEYFSGPNTEPYTFHFMKNPFWSKDIGCHQ